MAFEDLSEDFLTPEVGIVAVAAATLLSPPVRGAIRRGAVAGLAGLLAAGDGVASWARRLIPRGENADDAAFVRALADEARAERASSIHH